MKKQNPSKKLAMRKAKASKSLTKSPNKVTVTKAAKMAAVKSVSKKTKKRMVTKAAKVTAKKTIAKKIPKKKLVTKAAKATMVKSASKPVKKVAAAKTNAVKESATSSAFAKTTKPVAPMRERPLSPHLTIYRPQITSMLSILHRGTGVALYIGAFVLAAFIICLGYSEKCFTAWVDFFKTPVGTFMLFGWIFCLYYHLCNGIRHLMWDIGKGFAMPNVNISGMAVLFVSLTLTFTTFFITHPETLEYLKQWI